MSDSGSRNKLEDNDKLGGAEQLSLVTCIIMVFALCIVGSRWAGYVVCLTLIGLLT